MKNKRNINWLQLGILSFSLAVIFGSFHSCQKNARMKALIITGKSSYDWETSTEALEIILENSGLFTVEVAQSPSEGEDMGVFNPKFSNYKLVVLNYDGDSWSEQTKNAFVDYVKSGGGVVVYHGAGMDLPDWPEYSEIPVKEVEQGEIRGLLVVHRDREHPILKGLPGSWLHGNGQLYSALRDPVENRNILATAYSDTADGGTGKDEPVLFTVDYGEGRVFHDLLGNPDPENNESALHCAGFITTLLRGAEWAATGQVTQSVHPDFPNASSTFFWQDYRPLTLEELMSRITTYEIGKSRKYLADLSNRIRKSDGTAETFLMFEKEMVKVCESEATPECKKQLCRELSWMGSEYCIPTLKKLAEDPDVGEMAEFALDRLTK